MPQAVYKRLQSFVRDPETFEHAAELRQAGLRADHTQAPVLIGALKSAGDTMRFYSAVHALAQIGDAEALPAIEAALRDIDPHQQAHHFAEAARARLIAERDAKSLSDPSQKAQVPLQVFLQTLGTDAPGLNAAVARDTRIMLGTPHPYVGTGIYALRDLADMIYRRRDMTLAAVAKSSGIDFDLEDGARYKLQLAPLSSQQRVDWLINELANRKALTLKDNFLMQLCADEGTLASRAAAAKLMEMEQHKDQYADKRYAHHSKVFHPGLTAMFRVLQGVGDRDQEPVVAHFRHDAEADIRYYADQVYEDKT